MSINFILQLQRPFHTYPNRAVPYLVDDSVYIHCSCTNRKQKNRLQIFMQICIFTNRTNKTELR